VIAVPDFGHTINWRDFQIGLFAFFGSSHHTLESVSRNRISYRSQTIFRRVSRLRLKRNLRWTTLSALSSSQILNSQPIY
jgi:hypothetical protein